MTQTLLGAHFSIAGGLHNAFDHADRYHCNVMQIFTQNSNTWKIRCLSDEEVARFAERQKQSGVKQVIAHAGYLINLAGPDTEKWNKSYDAMKGELVRANRLDIPYLVVHPGSHRKTSVDKGIARVADGINRLYDEIQENKTTLLLETTAGQGDSVGHQLEHLSAIIDKVNTENKPGICIDTCHVFAAGYDIQTDKGYDAFIREIASSVGLEALRCIHLNDSKKEYGSKVDRHEHIGEGAIGNLCFQGIMQDRRLASVPKIIETPGQRNGIDMNRVNLDKLKSMV